MEKEKLELDLELGISRERSDELRKIIWDWLSDNIHGKISTLDIINKVVEVTNTKEEASYMTYGLTSFIRDNYRTTKSDSSEKSGEISITY